jgi:glycosyltransferase involved in cell wall biosynthesis
LLYVGRLCAEKGVMTLLQTLVLLAEEMPGMSVSGYSGHHLHLTIVGTGERDYHQHIQRYIHRHHLADHVTLHGQVAQCDLIGIYDRADILIVPSRWNEPFGLVAVEAMARQLPVVASAVGGLTEILTDGVDGMLVPPGDEHALASALRQLIARPDLRERLGRAARMTVTSRFSLGEQVANVADHLQRSIRGEIPPPTAARPAGRRSLARSHRRGNPLNASGRTVERGSHTS